MLNLVKAGSTVPMKFGIFKGREELTVTSSVKAFTPTRMTCDTHSPVDDIEVTTSGGTALRYDTSTGQYIQNWQTPKLPGTCYRVTLTAQDGSALTAHFKLK